MCACVHVCSMRACVCVRLAPSTSPKPVDMFEAGRIEEIRPGSGLEPCGSTSETPGSRQKGHHQEILRRLLFFARPSAPLLISSSFLLSLDFRRRGPWFVHSRRLGPEKATAMWHVGPWLLRRAGPDDAWPPRGHSWPWLGQHRYSDSFCRGQKWCVACPSGT